MHEFALAEAVIATALETAAKEGIARLSRIVVRIGELQAIEREPFELALRQAIPAAESRLARTRIVVEDEPARFRCRPCDVEFGLDETGGPLPHADSEAVHFVPELAHAFLRCPGCGSPDFEVLQGRGVTLQTLEGE